MRQCPLCDERCVFYESELDAWEAFCHKIRKNIRDATVVIPDDDALWQRQKTPKIFDKYLNG